MSYSTAKQNFFQWINSLEHANLSNVDKKLLNLLINNFDTLITIGTAGGLRSKKIGKLIESEKINLSPILPDLGAINSAESQTAKSITELKIGPFRGFSREETFNFEKKYTFMYGPNGSGKSSFCEGLEYALLGYIEEADAKRIDLSTYAKNTATGISKRPIVYSSKEDLKRFEVIQNPNVYRFSFIEKNRIDSFGRIAATTTRTQQDRIATLFGLDSFNDFVNGFSDSLDERYLTLINHLENTFYSENQQIKLLKLRIEEIDNALKDQINEGEVLLKEFNQIEINTIEKLNLFLNGETGNNGRINYLQEVKAKTLPVEINVSIYENLIISVKELQNIMDSLNSNKTELSYFSAELNYRELYQAIESIFKEPLSDKNICPACKTSIGEVTINPFTNAKTELIKMEHLAKLQNKNQELLMSLSNKIRYINNNLKDINKLKEVVNNKYPDFPIFTELNYVEIKSIEKWKGNFVSELQNLNNIISYNTNLLSAFYTYNDSLIEKRNEKSRIDAELTTCQLLKGRLDKILAIETALTSEKEVKQKLIDNFISQNEKMISDIAELEKVIQEHKEYQNSYQSLIGQLKKYRNELPSLLASGLSDKTKEYFNTINAHDPDFEKIEYLQLPTSTGEKITIRFHGDPNEYDALLILSEGHIKVLGLSILLSKVVTMGLGFIIFDDIVNAIDDEHRDGIAELLLNNSDIKDKQLIITCHGELFINKLEHKLGASCSSKNVINYRFVPSDIINERGVKISIGDSRHYILLAKQHLMKDERKDAAFRCRQAIESISEQLWAKLNKILNINLTVKMRSPGSKPDLSTVVDSLIKEIKNIARLNDLHENLKSIKEKYPWSLLNKGTHEQGDLPEFARNDIKDLIDVLEEIERMIPNIKLQAVNSINLENAQIISIERVGSR